MVPFVVPQRGKRLIIIMLAISLIIRTTICYAHGVPFVVPFVVSFVIRFNSGQCSFNEHGICMLICVAFTIKAEEILHIKRLSSLYVFARKKPKIEGAFKKPRRMHLGSDGLEHCPVTGCEHPGFASQRGCRKHVKNNHAWYYYFDAKPTVCTSPFAIVEAKEKVCKQQGPGCSTDNDFARSFSPWLQRSCGGGKSRKQSDNSVTRALKFLKFCCDENGVGEEDLMNSTTRWDHRIF